MATPQVLEMLANDPLSKAIRQVFQACQDDSVSCGKSVSRFRKIYGQCETEKEKKSFFKKFIFYLQLPLTAKERSHYVDECLEVACKLVASYIEEAKEKEDKDKSITTTTPEEEEEDYVELPPLMNRLIHWLLDHHEVEGSQARLRICLMLNRLMKLMGEDASIDDDLYQKIFDNMLMRLKDKVTDIRSQAVTALQRLQDPRDESCPILKAFLFHMSCDPSPAVRRTVVRCIGASKLTLPHILKRTRDVDEGVRKATFKFIADKIHIKSLTISQREQVLQRGLADRSEGVKMIVERDLVPAWLRLCNDNIVELLYALDVGISDGKIASDVLNVLFKSIPFRELTENFNYIDNNKLIPFEKLTPETAVYWKNVTKYLFKEGGGAHDCLEKLLPELTQFCAYLRHYVIEIEKPEDDLTWVFIAKQLIEMTGVFDLADEVGRNNLGLLCKDLMAHKKVTTPFIEPLMEIFTTIRTNTDARIQEVTEIIAELRDPMKEDKTGPLEEKPESPGQANNTDEASSKSLTSADDQRRKQVQIAQVRVQLNILKNDMEEAVQNKDFLKAQNIKIEMEKLDIEQNQLQEELTEATAMAAKPNSANNSRHQLDLETNEVDSTPPVDDPTVIHKCLEMIFQLMQDPKIKSLNATLQTLVDELVLPSIRDLEAEIRKSAVRAMGVCCLRSLDLARKNLLLLFHISHLDQSDVRICALAMVNDLLMWHGLPAFITQEKEFREVDEISNIDSLLESELSDTATYKDGHRLTQADLNSQGGNSVVAILSKLLDDQDLEIRTKVAEGLCKLLMIGSINSAKLFQRLILMWYNPLAESDGKLRHILGTFFPLYASMSRANQDCIEEAFLPTLKTLFNAPPTSPLAEIDVEDLGNFFVQLTREDFLQVRASDGPNVHDTMAYSLSNEIISTPDSFYTKSLIKILLSLQLTTNDYVKLKELKKLQEEMMEVVNDKLCLKNIDKFGATLAEWIKADPNQNEPEKEEAAAAEEEGATDKPENASEEPEAADSENTLNATKANKRRILFNHNNTTMLTPRQAGESNEPCSSISSGNSVFLSPKPPTPKAKRFKSNVVTKIDDTSSEDEDDEELVSGNLSRHGKKGLMKKNRLDSESLGNKSKFAAITESSDEDADDDIFANKTAAPISSTQMVISTTPNAEETTTEEGETEAATAAKSIKNFTAKEVEKPGKKLRKTASSTEDEEGDTSGTEVNKEKGGTKRSKKAAASKSVPESKKASVRSSTGTPSKRKVPAKEPNSSSKGTPSSSSAAGRVDSSTVSEQSTASGPSRSSSRRSGARSVPEIVVDSPRTSSRNAAKKAEIDATPTAKASKKPTPKGKAAPPAKGKKVASLASSQSSSSQDSVTPRTRAKRDGKGLTVQIEELKLPPKRSGVSRKNSAAASKSSTSSSYAAPTLASSNRNSRKKETPSSDERTVSGRSSSRVKRTSSSAGSSVSSEVTRSRRVATSSADSTPPTRGGARAARAKK